MPLPARPPVDAQILRLGREDVHGELVRAEFPQQGKARGREECFLPHGGVVGDVGDGREDGGGGWVGGFLLRRAEEDVEGSGGVEVGG